MYRGPSKDAVMLFRLPMRVNVFFDNEAYRERALFW